MSKTITKQNSFGTRLSGMLKVDARRLFRTPLLWIMVGACLVMPILITVMVTMNAGKVTVDPNTGAETVMSGFESVWQLIGSLSGSSSGMTMDITTMCNINMLYFLAAVLVCLFVSDDFRSGYAKNIFTVRAKKTDYVASKTILCTLGGMMMILAFFVGSLIGGVVSGLSFAMTGFNAGNLVMCILSKCALMAVFTPIYLALAVAAKQRTWLSMLLSFMCGMFLFMMIPMLTPLNASLGNVCICLVGGAMFGFGLGAVSNLILKKTSLI